MSRRDRLWALIEPWLAAEGVELDDLEIVGSGRGHTVRVVVDTEDGVDLERLSDLSEGISRLLDTEPDLDDPYHLELTSPGLERKLTRRRHYEKSVGREVSVKVRRDAGTEVLKGLLTVVGDDTFAVNVGGDIHEVAYEAVTSARTVFRWESTPKPGKR